MNSLKELAFCPSVAVPSPSVKCCFVVVEKTANPVNSDDESVHPGSKSKRRSKCFQVEQGWFLKSTLIH